MAAKRKPPLLPDLVPLDDPDGEYPTGLPLQIGDRVVDSLEEASSLSGRPVLYGPDGEPAGLA